MLQNLYMNMLFFNIFQVRAKRNSIKMRFELEYLL